MSEKKLLEKEKPFAKTTPLKNKQHLFSKKKTKKTPLVEKNRPS